MDLWLLASRALHRSSLQCVTTLTVYTRCLVWLLAPVFAFVVLLLFWLIPLWICDKRDFNDNPQNRITRRRWRTNAAKLVLFTLFLIYPGISRQMLGMLVCIPVEGVALSFVCVRVLSLFCSVVCCFDQANPTCKRTCQSCVRTRSGTASCLWSLSASSFTLSECHRSSWSVFVRLCCVAYWFDLCVFRLSCVCVCRRF